MLILRGAVQGTPPSVHDMQATSSDWDLIMNKSRPPSRRMSGTSSTAGPSQNKVCHCTLLDTWAVATVDSHPDIASLG